MSWPKISIIVPSFNQGQYLEETLRSVLDQNYPALELIVMDAGSTDGSAEILRRYSDRLAHWESQPDRGQSHAINKGLARCTGEVWAYLNSDDLLGPGSLARVGELFRDPATDWVGGVSTIFDERGDRGDVTPQAPKTVKEILTPWNRSIEHVFPCSNVNFMRRTIYERLGGFAESYHYSMDMEYYTRAVFAGYLLRRIPEVLGRWRWHAESKTVREGRIYRFLEEELRIARIYAERLPPAEAAALHTEIAHHGRWYSVRRALNENPHGPRWRKLCRLFTDVAAQPSLLFFRPWWGAIREQFGTP
jgi:glycosyltransferase involved in cell wall biosynthesis